MYKNYFILLSSPPPPVSDPVADITQTGRGEGGGGGVQERLRMCKQRRTHKYLDQNKQWDNTCNSSCCTTCIWTRHWAVLLSSRACSLLRCLQNTRSLKAFHSSKDYRSPATIHARLLGWRPPCRVVAVLVKPQIKVTQYRVIDRFI